MPPKQVSLELILHNTWDFFHVIYLINWLFHLVLENRENGGYSLVFPDSSTFSPAFFFSCPFISMVNFLGLQFYLVTFFSSRSVHHDEQWSLNNIHCWENIYIWRVTTHGPLQLVNFAKYCNSMSIWSRSWFLPFNAYEVLIHLCYCFVRFIFEIQVHLLLSLWSVCSSRRPQCCVIYPV